MESIYYSGQLEDDSVSVHIALQGCVRVSMCTQAYCGAQGFVGLLEFLLQTGKLK